MLRSKILIYFAFISSLFAKEIIAILDLEQIGLTQQEATILTQRLITRLIAIDRYQVVERNNMDKILKEQKFQHSGCTDAECAVEIGQLLNSDYIVTGSVNKFGDTYALDARLIDVGLGKSIISAEFSMTGKIDALLTTGITSIAKQLCGINTSTTMKESTQSNITSTSSSGLGASLEINSDPPGAEINIDGNYFGITPFILENYPAGNYEIELKLNDYKDYTESVRLIARGSKKINAKLQGIPNSKISFAGSIPDPFSVIIKINGKRHFVTRHAQTTDVIAGTNVIMITQANRTVFTDTVNVEYGKTVKVRYKLESIGTEPIKTEKKKSFFDRIKN